MNPIEIIVLPAGKLMSRVDEAIFYKEGTLAAFLTRML